MKKWLAHITPLIIMSTCLCLVGCSTFLQRRYQQGEHAFLQQDYHQAFGQLIQAARYQNTNAQYAVGYMYYFGLGTQQNDYLARLWFFRAADYGNKKAIAALQAINSTEQQPIYHPAGRVASRFKQPASRKTYNTTQPIQLPTPHNTLADIPKPHASAPQIHRKH